MMVDAAGASESEAPGAFSEREHEKAAASEITATMEYTVPSGRYGAPEALFYCVGFGEKL